MTAIAKELIEKYKEDINENNFENLFRDAIDKGVLKEILERILLARVTIPDGIVGKCLREQYEKMKSLLFTEKTVTESKVEQEERIKTAEKMLIKLSMMQNPDFRIFQEFEDVFSKNKGEAPYLKKYLLEEIKRAFSREYILEEIEKLQSWDKMMREGKAQSLANQTRGNLSYQLTPPESCQMAYSMASNSYSVQAEIENRVELKRDTIKKEEKKGFLGLFGRKKKADKEDIAAPPPSIDSVQFSAVAPNKVVAGKYLPINIVMYEESFRKAVDNIIRSHGENAKEAKSGYHDVVRNSLIKVILTSNDVMIEDGEQEQKWNGKYLNLEFAAKTPKDFEGEQILLSVDIYINDVIATKLKLILDCEKKPKKNISITRTDIVSAFVSYASQDLERVAAIIQGMRKARPDMDIFLDVENLRSGQVWSEVLESEIASRDVLFLCWSKYARASEWVDREWRYALKTKGEDGIEPIPIDPPNSCPPPIELQQKHFNDKMLFIIQAATHEWKGPCLFRVKTKECLPIKKSMVSLGKQQENVDLFIGDNARISRNHANIFERNGNYYIIDLNSMNHTYVDDVLIPGNVETRIYFGTKIRLADEEFEFIYKK